VNRDERGGNIACPPSRQNIIDGLMERAVYFGDPPLPFVGRQIEISGHWAKFGFGDNEARVIQRPIAIDDQS